MEISLLGLTTGSVDLITHVANDRDPLERILENNDDILIEATLVGQNPQVDPIAIDLMITDPYAPLWQIDLLNCLSIRSILNELI